MWAMPNFRRQHCGRALGELYRSLQDTVRLPSRVALGPIKELRGRQINALMLIARVLKRTCAGDDVADLFADLAIALHGLDVSIDHPMFEVSKKVGHSVRQGVQGTVLMIDPMFGDFVGPKILRLCVGWTLSFMPTNQRW